jgi:hypothetical protein
VRFDRRGFNGPIDVRVNGLDVKKGVQVAAVTVPAGQDFAMLEFSASADAEEVEQVARVLAVSGLRKADALFTVTIQLAAAPKIDVKLLKAGVVTGKVVRVHSLSKILIVEVQTPQAGNQLATQRPQFQAIAAVLVRTAQPREEFDEKGRLRKFTREELKELKGPDPKVPGYKAEFSDLSAGQIVQVSLGKPKGAGAEATRYATMIVVLKEAPPAR